MAKFKAGLGSNTGIEIVQQGQQHKSAWVTIDQGSKFIQTAATVEDLEKFSLALTSFLESMKANAK